MTSTFKLLKDFINFEGSNFFISLSFFSEFKKSPCFLLKLIFVELIILLELNSSSSVKLIFPLTFL